jgi:hypothetical protein
MSPELHAVVEVGDAPEVPWLPRPARARSALVRLSGSTSHEETSLVVALLSSYGRGGAQPAGTPAELAATFPTILPGGIAVVSGELQILPGCCCGLESWREWLEVLKSGSCPWTGHDPAPLVECQQGHVLVWNDGGLGDVPAGSVPVRFSRDEFAKSLAEVEEDLHAFAERLRTLLSEATPAFAGEIVHRFQMTFIEPKRTPAGGG